MDTLKECFEDFTEITNVRRLRGCLLHACRILDRQGNSAVASEWRARIKHMPSSMKKESINYVLLSAAIELKLIN